MSRDSLATVPNVLSLSRLGLAAAFVVLQEPLHRFAENLLALIVRMFEAGGYPPCHVRHFVVEERDAILEPMGHRQPVLDDE